MPSIEIATDDGYRLTARLFPVAGERRGVALVVPAMAVTQDYYEPFATWLAGQGWEVLTFDLRGIGASRPATLQGFPCDILLWARQDCAAALAQARGRAADQPVVWIGHSLGGQILAMTPGSETLAAAVTVACGVGYWRENAWPLRAYAWLLWYAIAPVATALRGYFPGQALRILGDLPAGVMRQWTRWCRHPEYAVGVEGQAMRDRYRRLTLPLLSLSFTDDEFMSERNVAVLHGFYANASKEMRRIAPADAGRARIGHFGYFRPGSEAALWPSTLAWIERAARRSTSAPSAASSRA